MNLEKMASVTYTWVNISIYIIISTFVFADHGRGCPEYFTDSTDYPTSNTETYDGKCYQFVDKETEWEPARDYCWKNSGSLVIINNQRVHNVINNILDTMTWTNNGIWIGLNDKNTQNEWTWVTYSKYNSVPLGSWTNWEVGHPHDKNSDHNCVRIVRGDWRWQVTRCSNIYTWYKYRFICQYEQTLTQSTKRTTTKFYHSTVITALPSTKQNNVRVTKSTKRTTPEFYHFTVITALRFTKKYHVRVTKSDESTTPMLYHSTVITALPSTKQNNVAVALSVVGVVAVIFFIILIIVIVWRRHSNSNEVLRESAQHSIPNQYVSNGRRMDSHEYSEPKGFVNNHPGDQSLQSDYYEMSRESTYMNMSGRKDAETPQKEQFYSEID